MHDYTDNTMACNKVSSAFRFCGAGYNRNDTMPVFEAVLYPPRALKHKEFAVIAGFFGFYSAFMGSLFLNQGAWLITGFIGVEIIIVLSLFGGYYFYAQKCHEKIILTDTKLLIVDNSSVFGRANHQKIWSFEPGWTKVKVEEKTTDTHVLKIFSHGQGVILGSFLTSSEKKELAEALREALEKWKRDIVRRVRE